MLEVKRSRMQELGIQWPTQFTVLTPESIPKTFVNDGVVVTEQAERSVLTLENAQEHHQRRHRGVAQSCAERCARTPATSTSSPTRASA